MIPRIASLAAALLAALALAGSTGAWTTRQPMVLGIRGDASRFHGLTGQQSAVVHEIIGWDQGRTWGASLPRLLASMGDAPMLGLNTRAKWPSRREAITPQQIALGRGDAFLLALNAAIAQRGTPVYLRPFGEMNGSWNVYCAFTRGGRVKPGHQTSWFRKAFARVYLLAHGGPLAEVNAALAGLRLPAVAATGDLPANPFPALRVVWNPQGFGNPNIPANSAQAYYPGDRFVDMVGDDLYDIGGKAEWKAADALYKAHPSKPFAFPEWGLWGIDDPSFIRAMHDFVVRHPRTELLAYFESAAGSKFDLATKPRARAAYRALITPLG